MGDDSAKSDRAAKILSENPKNWPKMASALAISDEDIRRRFFSALAQAKGDPHFAVLQNVHYVRLSAGHFKSFSDYFEQQGDTGYAALLKSYRLHAQTLGKRIRNKDFGVTTMAYFYRMEDIGRLIMAMSRTDVTVLIDLLPHPFEGARELTTKILCSKNYRQKMPDDSINAEEIQIYFSNLVPMTGCEPAKGALEIVAQMGRADFARWLNIENKFPAPATAHYRIFVKIGSDEAVEYLESRALETDNSYLYSQLVETLSQIDTTRAKQALSRLQKNERNP
jgi:hypothetical protein